MQIASQLFVIVFCIAAQAADPLAPEGTSSAQQRLAFAKQSAGQYRFRAAGLEPGTIRLHPNPLLRWDNQVVREEDGMLFLWTEGANGRPVAAAQFFLQSPDWHHEFQSLSVHGFEASLDDSQNWTWRPNRPGVKFERVDMVEAPAETASARLRQMRGIAERYDGATDPTRSGKFEDPHELRLLTTPVYRYSAETSGIQDGAIFVFAQGTNPEVLVLIEAGKTANGGWEWRRGFAPMSSFQLRVRQGETVVFEQEVAVVPTTDVTSPYHFRWRALEDGSADMPIVADKSE